MYLTDYDVEHLFQFAVRRTANKLEIRDHEWKSSSELLYEIQLADAHTYELLIKFIEAYKDWYQFSKSMGATSDISQFQSQQQKLIQKIEIRDQTRRAILQRLKSL